MEKRYESEKQVQEFHLENVNWRHLGDIELNVKEAIEYKPEIQKTCLAGNTNLELSVIIFLGM
jgi:hypothetical protein